MVYSIGFGVPALLHLVLKFLKCTTLSLPDVFYIAFSSFAYTDILSAASS